MTAGVWGTSQICIHSEEDAVQDPSHWNGSPHTGWAFQTQPNLKVFSHIYSEDWFHGDTNPIKWKVMFKHYRATGSSTRICGEKRGKTEDMGYMPLNTKDFSQSQKPIRSWLQIFPRISNNNWTFQSDHKKLELFPFSLMLWCQLAGICQCLPFITVEVLPAFLLVRGETTPLRWTVSW